MKRLVAALAVFVAAGCAAGPPPERVQLAGDGERYSVTVALGSASTGVINAEVHVEDRARPPDPVAAVSLSAAMPDMGHAMPEVSAQPQGTDRFLAHGELFAMPGAWDLAVRVEGAPGAETITVRVVVEG